MHSHKADTQVATDILMEEPLSLSLMCGTPILMTLVNLHQLLVGYEHTQLV